MPAGRPTKMSKRKNENNIDAEDKSKKQRRRRCSDSESLQNDTVNPEKREALRRLFGRCWSSDGNNRPPPKREAEESDTDDDDFELIDENDDPLLDSVPCNMDPEQLGFLVCAQETLRFLSCRGIAIQDPVFLRLRSRLLRGIVHIAAA